jgi:hypothetical protein
MAMKFNRILAAFFSVICLASCEDFLSEGPTTSLSEDSVYSNEANLEAGAIGVYAALKGTNYGWTKQMGEFIAYPSILIHWKDNRTADNYVQTLTCSMYPTSVDNQGLYDFIYDPIYKINKMIEAMEISPVDQAYKNEIEGEMKFLRAWQYYAAVRFWGDVPLIIATPKNIDETDAPRVHYAEVYKQIIADLEYAEQNMRTPERVEAVGGMTGRPNRWAATSLKASVYMQLACIIENKEYQFFDYQNKPERDCDFSSLGINSAADAWQLCLQTAEKVINEGPYELAKSYLDLFNWGPDVVDTYKSKERIFVLQDTKEGGASYLAVRSLPPYWNGPTKNNNHGRWRPLRYVPWKWATVHGGVKWTGRGDKLTNLYKSVPDPRYDASYIHTKYTNMSTGKAQNIWPNNNVTSSSYYEPYFKKYSDPSFDVSVTYSDLYLMRYAEVYLIAAEAAASLSAGKDDANWQKAMDYMEVIHARARKSVAAGKAEAAHPKMSNWNCQTKEDLIKAIMWERVFEMHGELHEIFDTHRRGGKFMSEWLCKPINEWLKMPEQVYNNNGKVAYTYFSRAFQGIYLPEDPVKLRKSVLLAFPEHEIRNNNAIGYEDQNDFYWSSLEN